MYKKSLVVTIALFAVLAIFLLLVWLVGDVLGVARFQTGENPILRFVFVCVGIVIVGAVYMATAKSKAWEVGTREVVWMAIGAALYAVFSWLFNGTVFFIPSVSQVALRPAIAIPMFFGYAFGPIVGFFSGAVGNMFGDALTGFGLYPQWSIGNGLVGFIAGLPMLFKDKKRSVDIVLIVGSVLTVLAVVVFLMNRDQPNTLFYDVENNIFGDAPISLFAGIAIAVGLILILSLRFLPKYFYGVAGYLVGGSIAAVFVGSLVNLFRVPILTLVVYIIAGLVGGGYTAVFAVKKLPESKEDIAAAVIWGMLGNILGIGFAAISDIWINGYSPVTAIVGEFLPAAGPNLIFAAILVPLLVGAYAAVRRQSGR